MNQTWPTQSVLPKTYCNLKVAPNMASSISYKDSDRSLKMKTPLHISITYMLISSSFLVISLERCYPLPTPHLPTTVYHLCKMFVFFLDSNIHQSVNDKYIIPVQFERYRPYCSTLKSLWQGHVENVFIYFFTFLASS